MRIVVLLCSALVTGCAGSPARIAMMNESDLKTVDNYALCRAYASGRSDTVKTELASRNVISAEDWQLVEAKKLGIGMSRLALACVMGVPLGGRLGHINSTTTANGVSEQWVFDEFSSPRYVYVRDGKVTAWQN